MSWASSTGATGYTVQRSTNNGSTWTSVITTAAGTTTYQDTGLTAGTTYEYRVQANGGNGSGFSNTASATTSAATTSGTTDTIWSNSYTPSENEYASGSYDVGVKFTPAVAGTVTGARFYKQTWMGGYTHVGYLWSSSGSMLAKATFTGESSYGWQQVNFSSPVAIAANTTYIVSFSTGGGYFGITSGYFNSGGVTNGPLQALGNSVPGGDGVYGSGNGAFPSLNGSGMNFWADVTFSPSSTASASPALASPSSGVSFLQASASTSGTLGASSEVVTATTAVSTSTLPVRAVSSRVKQDSDPIVVSFRRYVPQTSTLGSSLPGGARSFRFIE